jgi:hypothetical protein
MTANDPHILTSTVPVMLILNDRGRDCGIPRRIDVISMLRQMGGHKVALHINHENDCGFGPAASHDAIIGAVLDRITRRLETEYGDLTHGYCIPVIARQGDTVQGKFVLHCHTRNEAQAIAARMEELVADLCVEPIKYVGSVVERLQTQQADERKRLEGAVEDILIARDNASTTSPSTITLAFDIRKDLAKGRALGDVLEETLGGSDGTAAVEKAILEHANACKR